MTAPANPYSSTPSTKINKNQQRGSYTKADLIAQIHKSADGKLTKADAERVFEQILSTFTETLAAGEEISFIGFGSFIPTRCPERKGRYPRTGEEITIPAGTTVKFTPAKALKEAMK